MYKQIFDELLLVLDVLLHGLLLIACHTYIISSAPKRHGPRFIFHVSIRVAKIINSALLLSVSLSTYSSRAP